MKIEFDPEVISYKKLLAVFFAMHDPTTLDRQGADSGTQYRSIILYENEKQKKTAEEFVEKLGEDKIFEQPVVTEIMPLLNFFPSEEHHQKYFENNPTNPYCQINISPKVAKLREKFKRLVK